MMGGSASDGCTQSQHSSGNSSDRGHYDMTRIQHDHHASNRNSSEHGGASSESSADFESNNDDYVKSVSKRASSHLNALFGGSDNIDHRDGENDNMYDAFEPEHSFDQSSMSSTPSDSASPTSSGFRNDPVLTGSQKDCDEEDATATHLTIDTQAENINSGKPENTGTMTFGGGLGSSGAQLDVPPIPRERKKSRIVMTMDGDIAGIDAVFKTLNALYQDENVRWLKSPAACSMTMQAMDLARTYMLFKLFLKKGTFNTKEIREQDMPQWLQRLEPWLNHYIKGTIYFHIGN